MSDPVTEKTFVIDEGGVKLLVFATLNPDGTLNIRVELQESSLAVDVNAFWWSDGDDTADAKLKKGDQPLNMNGTDVAWDDYHKISSPGTPDGKDGYLTDDNPSFSFNLPAGVTFSDLDTIGIRGTSVGPDGEGSIKGVGEPYEPEEPESLFPDIGKDISNVVLYFSDFPAKPDGVSQEQYDKWLKDGFFTIKIDNLDGAGGSDLDDSWDAILAEVQKMYPDLDLTSLLGIEIKTGNLKDVDTSDWDDETPYEFEVLDGPGQSNSVFIDFDPDDDFTSDDLVENKDIDVTIQYSVVA